MKSNFHETLETISALPHKMLCHPHQNITRRALRIGFGAETVKIETNSGAEVYTAPAGPTFGP